MYLFEALAKQLLKSDMRLETLKRVIRRTPFQQCLQALKQAMKRLDLKNVAELETERSAAFPVLMLRRQRFEQQTIQPQFLMLGIGDLERSRGLNDPAVAFRYPFVASAISQHSLTARYGH